MHVLEPEQAGRLLVHATALARVQGRGAAARAALLDRLCAIQLDPIDRIGTNADLVLHARLDGVKRGDWARLMPGLAFEHFAKERCLLPARAFPFYRDAARAEKSPRTRWWRLEERLGRLDDGLLRAVRDEVAARGPLSAQALGDHGRVAPLDWSGWKGTGKAGSLALEALWTRCEVVVAGRGPGGARLYDLPERALPLQFDAPGGPFAPWALRERVRAAGLLCTAGGVWWSTIDEVRRSDLPGRLVAAGALAKVRISGARREYLCLPETLDGPWEEPDDRMRVLGPLDPLLWDRRLVEHVFGFEYAWEVYKPEHLRRWGYYVCPLLWEGRLAGRFEGRRVAGGVEVVGKWGEVPKGPFARAVERLSGMQGGGEEG